MGESQKIEEDFRGSFISTIARLLPHYPLGEIEEMPLERLAQLCQFAVNMRRKRR